MYTCSEPLRRSSDSSISLISSASRKASALSASSSTRRVASRPPLRGQLGRLQRLFQLLHARRRLAQVLLAERWARDGEGGGKVAWVSAHPGWVDTRAVDAAYGEVPRAPVERDSLALCRAPRGFHARARVRALARACLSRRR